MLTLSFLGEVTHDLVWTDFQSGLRATGIREGSDVLVGNGNGILGTSVNPASALEKFFDSEIDLVVTGERALARAVTRRLHELDHALLRPLNVPRGAPGKPSWKRETPAGAVLLLALCTGSWRQPLGDPFTCFETWLSTSNPAGCPVFVLFSGSDLNLKKAFFWRFSRHEVPVHVLGTGLGIAPREHVIHNRRLFIPDLGSCEAISAIEGLSPEHWIKENHEHLPISAVPPDEKLKLFGVKVRIDEKGLFHELNWCDHLIPAT
jgi:calcineurin-like phosphoesterase